MSAYAKNALSFIQEENRSVQLKPGDIIDTGESRLQVVSSKNRMLTVVDTSQAIGSVVLQLKSVAKVSRAIRDSEYVLEPATDMPVFMERQRLLHDMATLTSSELIDVRHRHIALDLMDHAREKYVIYGKRRVDYDRLADIIQKECKRQYEQMTLADLPSGPREHPQRKTPLEDGDISAGPRTSIGARKAPSGSSLQEWDIRRRRAGSTVVEAGMMQTALATNYRFCGGKRLKFNAVQAAAFLESVLFFMRREQPSVSETHRFLGTLIDRANAEAPNEPATDIPSRYHLEQAISLVPKFELVAAREGVKAALQKFKITGFTTDPKTIGERVEMDSWTTDLVTFFKLAGMEEVLDRDELRNFKKVRMTLTVALECATRVVLGMRLSLGEKTGVVKDTLFDCFQDKSQIADAAGCVSSWNMATGIAQLWTDNGSNYMSHEFADAAHNTVDVKGLTPAGVSYLRGRVERIFRTFACYLSGMVGGVTGSSPFDNPDYDPFAAANLSAFEYAQMLVTMVVDIYHNTPHAGLGGISPANKWKQIEHTRKPLPDDISMTVAFGSGGERKLAGHGLVFLHIAYNSAQLQKYYRENGAVSLEIRVDRRDISYAYVLIERSWELIRPLDWRKFEGVSLNVYLDALNEVAMEHAELATADRQKIFDAIYRTMVNSESQRERSAITAAGATDAEIKEAGRLIAMTSPYNRNNGGSEAELFDNSVPTGRHAIITEAEFMKRHDLVPFSKMKNIPPKEQAFEADQTDHYSFGFETSDTERSLLEAPSIDMSEETPNVPAETDEFEEVDGSCLD